MNRVGTSSCGRVERLDQRLDAVAAEVGHQRGERRRRRSRASSSATLGSPPMSASSRARHAAPP